MKLFLAGGRFGNQIFQYLFLKKIQIKNEKIIVSGFEELTEVFEINDLINLNKKNKLIRAILYKICNPILFFLTSIKIISSITINHETILKKYSRESTTYNSTHGFLKNITFVKHGFFQSDRFFDKNFADTLVFKEKYLIEATKLLKNIPIHSHKIFVHLRRTDYKEYTVYGESSLLPMSYFKDQIKWFTKNKNNCFFLFFSDEPEILSEEFEYIDNKIIISGNHFGTDLALMSQCKSAILSPSSFGWWGSYLMKERDTVFAPKYWLGFRSKIDYQDHGVPSFSKEIEV